MLFFIFLYIHISGIHIFYIYTPTSVSTLERGRLCLAYANSICARECAVKEDFTWTTRIPKRRRNSSNKNARQKVAFNSNELFIYIFHSVRKIRKGRTWLNPTMGLLEKSHHDYGNPTASLSSATALDKKIPQSVRFFRFLLKIWLNVSWHCVPLTLWLKFVWCWPPPYLLF